MLRRIPSEALIIITIGIILSMVTYFYFPMAFQKIYEMSKNIRLTVEKIAQSVPLVLIVYNLMNEFFKQNPILWDTLLLIFTIFLTLKLTEKRKKGVKKIHSYQLWKSALELRTAKIHMSHV